MFQPTMTLRILRVRDYSDAETRGVKSMDVLQQLWVDPDADDDDHKLEWRSIPVEERG